MNIEEFSASFDTMVSSFAHQGAFGEDASRVDPRFDEYEKSVFLTKSQEEIALSLYTGNNPQGHSFEQTEEIRRYLAPIVCERELTPIVTSNGMPLGMESSSSRFFTLPDNPPVWFITYEAVTISDGKCENTTTLDVYPVTQDEYHKIKRNPFRGANSHRALRLDLGDNNIEIISKYTVTKYYLRYLKKLNPIILTDIEDNNIGGYSVAMGCELPDVLHQRILERAVMMALQSKGYANNKDNK